MSADLNDVERIEREVAAEVDLLVAVLGADLGRDLLEPGADGDLSDVSTRGLAPVADQGADSVEGVRDDAAADAALLALIVATGRDGFPGAGRRTGSPALGAPVHVRRPGPGPGRGWWYGAAAAAIVLGLGGALALTPSTPAAAGPPMLRFTAGDAFQLLDADAAAALPSAHDTLLALGDAAAATVDPPSGGDVQYVQVGAWYASGDDSGTVLEPVQRDNWLAPDGSVRGEEARYGGFDPWGALVSVSIPPGVQTNVDEIPAGTFDPALAASASTDPALVLGDLVGPVALGGCDGVELSCTVSVVENTFTQYVVPSGTRAAIWRALGARSDMRLMGDVTDRLGRHGVGIGFHEQTNGWTSGGVFIVDPSTGALLGFERVVRLPDEQPRLAEVMAVERSATVAAVGDKP